MPKKDLFCFLPHIPPNTVTRAMLGLRILTQALTILLLRTSSFVHKNDPNLSVTLVNDLNPSIVRISKWTGHWRTKMMDNWYYRYYNRDERPGADLTLMGEVSVRYCSTEETVSVRALEYRWSSPTQANRNSTVCLRAVFQNVASYGSWSILQIWYSLYY